MSITLYESDDLKVIHHIGNESKKRVIITFNAHTPADRMKLVSTRPLMGGWQSELEKRSTPAIFIVAKRNHWFNSRDLQEAILCAQSIRNQYVYTTLIGASLGGHAAIRLSGRLGATAVVAISPQLCISRSIVGSFEHRWKGEAESIECYDIGIGKAPISGNIYIIHDNKHNVDDIHVSKISKLIETTGICLPYSGHSSARPLADLDLLESIFSINENHSINLATLHSILHEYQLNWTKSPAALLVRSATMPVKERITFLLGASDVKGHPRHIQELKDITSRLRDEYKAYLVNGG